MRWRKTGHFFDYSVGIGFRPPLPPPRLGNQCQRNGERYSEID